MALICQEVKQKNSIKRYKIIDNGYIMLYYFFGHPQKMHNCFNKLNIPKVVLNMKNNDPCKLNELDDDLLIECYHSAKELELSEDFIFLLKNEIKKRGLSTKKMT